MPLRCWSRHTLDENIFGLYVSPAAASVLIELRFLAASTPNRAGTSSSLWTLPAQYAEEDLWSGRASVRLSVWLSHRLIAAAACGGFAAERPAGRRYRSTAGVSAAATRRSAVNAGSVVLTAEERGWTQTRLVRSCQCASYTRKLRKEARQVTRRTGPFELH